VARGIALAAAVAVALLAVTGAGGAATQQTPKRGGTVVIAKPLHFEPACLNPLDSSCSGSQPERVLDGAYEATPDGGYRSDLATGTIVRRLPFTLHYRIRPDARWSDGVPVTAPDFVFTQRAIRERMPDDLGLHFPLDLHVTKVQSVRPLSARIVEVVLRAPYADWRELFPWVLPRHVLAGQDLARVWQEGIDNPRTGAPIGSGPFLVERLERGRQLVLRRNARYWGEHLAYLDRLVYRFLDASDVADALRRGEVDMIDPGPRLLQNAALELKRQRPPEIRFLTLTGGSFEHFDIRMAAGGHPALRDRRVRQALAYGIDREAIARAAVALSGTPDPRRRPLDSALFLETSRYYQPSWRRYRYRPEQAQRLLERAGCRRGADRIFKCDGERLSLRFVTSAGSDLRQRTIELAREHLRRVGVEVLPQYVPPVRLGEMIERREFDLFQFGWIVGSTTTWPLDVFGCQHVYNNTGYCDRLMTRDLDQATRILDDPRRARLLNRIDERLATAVPLIPLYATTSLLAFDVSIRGITPTTWDIAEWWLAESR
jgi:ABC-type transport system substrate-binding protein